jgi:hypothetical protein
MAREPKKRLTAAQRAAKKKRKAEFMTVFINGKQKRVRRPRMIEGVPAEEFVRRNADPVWLMQNGYYELLPRAPASYSEPESRRENATPADDVLF